MLLLGILFLLFLSMSYLFEEHTNKLVIYYYASGLFVSAHKLDFEKNISSSLLASCSLVATTLLLNIIFTRKKKQVLGTTIEKYFFMSAVMSIVTYIAYIAFELKSPIFSIWLVSSILTFLILKIYSITDNKLKEN